MLHPKTSISVLTLVAFIQCHVMSVWANPIVVQDQPSAHPLTTLYQGIDPYSQESFRLQYDPGDQRLLWQLVNHGYVQSSQVQALPKDTLMLDVGVVFKGDQIVVAGRTTDQRWFLQAWNSQGDSQWQRQGERGRIYDLAFSDDGLTVYAAGASDQGDMLLVIDALGGVITDRPDTQADTKSAYRQVVVTGDDEVVVARYTEHRGQLEYVKWQKSVNTAPSETLWRIVPGFCEGCESGCGFCCFEKRPAESALFHGDVQ